MKQLAVKNRITSISTNGNIQLDENVLLTAANNNLILTNIESGESRELELSANEDDELIHFIKVKDFIVYSTRNSILSFFRVSDSKLVKSFKPHNAPVLTMDAESTGSLLATGSADSSVKVWDLRHHHCTHVFNGHSGLVSIVKFHPDSRKLLLFSAGDDGNIRVWSLKDKKCIAIMESHVSVVRSLEFSTCGKYLFSAARDKVVNVWDLSNYTLISTIPVDETLEGLGVLSENLVYTVGDLGKIRIWDFKNSTCTKELPELTQHGIVDTAMNDKLIIVATGDQNIFTYKLDNAELSLYKTFSGYNDEILDMAYIDRDNIVVATNSELIKVYNLQTNNCTFLRGHTDIVLSVSVSKNKMIASASKDRTAIIWAVSSDGVYEPFATCSGHTDSITSVSISPKGNFVVTASSDKTVKLWKLNTGGKLESEYTFIAHDKDVNSVAIAPNERMFVTSSADKTAKVWNVEDGSLFGTLSGHKRGVWNVAFSPVEKVVATSSSDKTVKIWSLSDFSCLKTFEGHLNSILKVKFLASGTQILSAGSDGLLKLWNVKDTDCVNTFDEHEHKIWALDVSPNGEEIVTGGVDSKIVIWKDVTQELEEQEILQKEEDIRKESELQTFILRKDYKHAIFLAIDMEKPMFLLNVFREMMNKGLQTMIVAAIEEMEDDVIVKVLGYLKNWNTSVKFSDISQFILNSIIRDRDMLEMKGMKETVDALLPYSQKHYERAKKLKETCSFLDFVLESIQ